MEAAASLLELAGGAGALGFEVPEVAVLSGDAVVGLVDGGLVGARNRRRRVRTSRSAWASDRLWRVLEIMGSSRATSASWPDVDFLRRQLHVEQQVKLLHGKVVLDRPKAGKTRTVPLPTSVADELAAHLQRYPAQGAELVFTSREDKPINRSHFDPYIWHRALKATGV